MLLQATLNGPLAKADHGAESLHARVVDQFEDTLLLPGGQLAASNADLIRAAYELGAGRT